MMMPPEVLRLVALGWVSVFWSSVVMLLVLLTVMRLCQSMFAMTLLSSTCFLHHQLIVVE